MRESKRESKRESERESERENEREREREGVRAHAHARARASNFSNICSSTGADVCAVCVTKRENDGEGARARACLHLK